MSASLKYPIIMESNSWIARAQDLLRRSLDLSVPHELNELDWKRELSSNKERFTEHLSAFANLDQGGFLVFGVTHDGKKAGIDSSAVKNIIEKIGNAARDGLEPSCAIDHFIEKTETPGKVLLYIHIPGSTQKPVRLRGKSLEVSFIRSAGQTRKMNESEIRAALLRSRTLRFEELTINSTESAAILEDFEISAVCQRLKIPFSGEPERRGEIMVNRKFAAKTATGLAPTYLGVLVTGKDFRKLPGAEHYGIRLTRYRGNSKLEAERDEFYFKGFVHSLDQLIDDIMGLLPKSEVIEKATRRQVPVYPEIALRELIANAVIHRDYSRTDSYVQVEIFDDRIEITNPGSLLPDMAVDRLIDQQPRARNEILAALMRELGFCEERGSGIDKAASSLELYGLPAVHFINNPDYFRAILYAPKPYKAMDNEERLRTAYQHVCLHYVAGQKVTNASLRARLKLSGNQSQLVSALIRKAIDANLIKIANPGASPRYIHYVPYWA